jgi:hypothetical protein
VPYVRTVKTASGAMAVQIVYSYHRGSRQIEHIGSAHDEAELEAKARALAGPADLPPPAGLHRSPPHDRVRCPGRQPLDRRPDNLVYPHVRPHRLPLPHPRDPGR